MQLSIVGGVLGSLLGAYSQAGWECAIECNWERTWERTVKQAGSVQSSAIGCILESVLRASCERLESVLGRVQ